MKYKKIQKDNNSREIFSYLNPSYPLGVWTDVYSLMDGKCMDCHWHDDFEFGVMLSGELDYYIGNEYVHLKKGEGIFINANTLHRASQHASREDAIMFVITFQTSLFTGNANHLLYAKFFQYILDSKIQGFKIDNSVKYGQLIITELKEIYSLYENDDDYELLCLSKLCGIWYHTLKTVKEDQVDLIQKKTNIKYENEIKMIISYIQENYASDIKINDIAAYANISRSECFRCFPRFTSKKPVEYINEVRLSSAATMLRETNCSITEIGLKCGFSDSSYFSKLFKKRYDMTPLKYRKS